MEAKKLINWAEILATIAVFAGLLLLVQEIRVNTQAVQRQATVDRAAVLSEPFFQSAELRAASEKIQVVDGPARLESAFAEQYDLTPDEAIVWTRHLIQLWNVVQADFYYGDREVAENWVQVLLESPDNRLFIEHLDFHGEFGAMVRDVAARSD